MVRILCNGCDSLIGGPTELEKFGDFGGFSKSKFDYQIAKVFSQEWGDPINYCLVGGGEKVGLVRVGRLRDVEI